MPKSRLSRRKLLAGAAPLMAAPALSKLVLDGRAEAAEPGVHEAHGFSHAAMYGEGGPANGGPPAPAPNQKAHPKGLVRRFLHRPAEAAQAGPGARDGDQRLRHRRRRREQLL